MVNLATYVLWWNKPLNVECPIAVRRKDNTIDPRPEDQTMDEPETEAYVRTWSGRGFPLILVPFIPFLDMAGASDRAEELESNSSRKRVTTFYGGSLVGDEKGYTFCAGILVSGAFGAIHCAAWSFPFPSHEEQILWRVASLVVVCTPVAGCVFVWMLPVVGRENDVQKITAAFMFLYILARVVLLVQGFISLRSLPPAAYQMVHWTTVIPHIR